MHRAALTNSVHSSRSQNGEAGITTYTKSTRPYDALTVDNGSSRHFDSSAATALRSSEILALRWADILWEEKRIRVSKRWADGKDGQTKTDA